jgi:hypothetical protein
VKVTIVAELNENSRIPKWLVEVANSGAIIKINTARPKKAKPEQP